MVRWKRKRQLHERLGMRERTSQAVLRLLGGRLREDEVDEDIAELMEGEKGEGPVFDRRERLMISGVLQLGERPVRTVMTARADVDILDADAAPERLREQLLASAHSRLPLVVNGNIDEPLGYVHKKELFATSCKASRRICVPGCAPPSTCRPRPRYWALWNSCAPPRPTWPSWSMNSVVSMAC